ncbi:MAG: hypothetical protein GEU79_19405 [Acidimicrobiia bacterium]|nr:hypothetical protein [Acidimicrobiia bacterium]
MSLLTQAVVSGILTGGLYALMSLGMSLSWGVLKIINLAHFSFVLLAAYATYELSASPAWKPTPTSRSRASTSISSSTWNWPGLSPLSPNSSSSTRSCPVSTQPRSTNPSRWCVASTTVG